THPNSNLANCSRLENSFSSSSRRRPVTLFPPFIPSFQSLSQPPSPPTTAAPWALVVYDITRKATFESVQRWLDELKSKLFNISFESLIPLPRETRVALGCCSARVAQPQIQLRASCPRLLLVSLPSFPLLLASSRHNRRCCKDLVDLLVYWFLIYRIMASMGSKTSGDAVDSTQPLEMETPTEPQTEPTEIASEAQAEPIATAPTNAIPEPRSIAWDNFTRTKARDRANCNHYSTLITCKGKQGTSTSAMLNHLRRCKAKLDEVQDEERPGKRIKQ
ncbi:RAB GTPase homolog A5E, partial [Striga asiatica]